MPRKPEGTRLWLQPEERNEDGNLIRRAAWVIRDGTRKVRTGCVRDDREGAERALAVYITARYQVPRERDRHPAQILVLDVLNIYLADVAKGHARPQETKQRILTLADFWQSYTLADVNGSRCREYVAWRIGRPWKSSKPAHTGRPARLVTEAAARRELEDLRSAINHHRREGLCSGVISVVLPEKRPSREVWLTRSEVARLIWAAYRAKQIMSDKVTARDIGKHIARLILVGLYTGTRHAAMCGAAFQPAIGREGGQPHRREPAAADIRHPAGAGCIPFRRRARQARAGGRRDARRTVARLRLRISRNVGRSGADRGIRADQAGETAPTHRRIGRGDRGR
jgi:hypothetical protein